MSTTITVSAHPTPPNTVVCVNVYDEGSHKTQSYVMQEGAIQSFTITDKQQVSICEDDTLIVSAYTPPTPSPVVDDQPVVEQPSAPSTTG